MRNFMHMQIVDVITFIRSSLAINNFLESYQVVVVMGLCYQNSQIEYKKNVEWTKLNNTNKKETAINEK